MLESREHAIHWLSGDVQNKSLRKQHVYEANVHIVGKHLIHEALRVCFLYSLIRRRVVCCRCGGGIFNAPETSCHVVNNLIGKCLYCPLYYHRIARRTSLNDLIAYRIQLAIEH